MNLIKYSFKSSPRSTLIPRNGRCVRSNWITPLTPRGSNLWQLQWTQTRAFSKSYCLFNESEPKPQPESEAPKEENPPAEKEPEKPQVDNRDQKIEELTKTVIELRNNIKFGMAEVENTRKRLQKDVDKAKEFGVEKLVKNLFSVTDTINICLQNKPVMKENENVDAVIAFEALETTKKQMLSVFKDSYAIEEFIPTIGDPFDPMHHNALFEVDPPQNHPEATPGTIGLVVKSGWRRNHQLLRPAGVGVVKQKDMGNDLSEDTSLDE
eukprot:TRINITY_DN911_c0_g1_i1.p1 TRINITY_DN911_c0_g1~~TRINITY_DN911_c0_g1_i1.p1  ORF type:complete len:267 (-),score=67.97 TRINITY_DN911_c0_g1_i1:104-904(-)